MDIEKLATSAVKESISLTDVLSPFINDGDKEPSWDGNIYIHEDKRKNKIGIKKVPVQVKGEIRKIVPLKKKPKYSVSLTDLNNWLNDGGIMLFVVYFDEKGENKTIYYSALLPILIRQIMSFARGKKTSSIPLKEFPLDNDKKVGILLDYYNHKQKQTSFANAPLYSAEELAQKGVLENITISATGYGKRSEIDVDSLFLSKDVYMYAKVKGVAILQPLPDVAMDVSIWKNVYAEVRVKDKVYYSEYKAVRNADGTNIFIGKSLSLKLTPEKRVGTLDFRLKGTLSDYIKDTECIIAIIENKELSINKAIFQFDDIGDASVDQYKQSLIYYKDVKKMLNLLGVNGEIECDNLSEMDNNNIRNFTNALVMGGDIGFPNNNNDMIFGRFQLANLVVLIWADKIKKNSKSYRLQSFFSDHKVALFEEDDTKKEKPYSISHYAIMKKNDFLEATNIDYKKIIEDISQNDSSPIVTNQLILFMLEMLKAYDEQKNKNEELLETAEKYCDWLTKNSKDSSDIMTLNRLQIIRRRRQLNDSEKLQLNEIRKKSTINSIKCGASILLGKMEIAQKFFEKMSENEKEAFLDYPICYFGKPNYIKTEKAK